MSAPAARRIKNTFRIHPVNTDFRRGVDNHIAIQHNPDMCNPSFDIVKKSQIPYLYF